jgi:putative ABC transport system permease protein
VPIRYNVRSLLVRKVTTIATAVGIALVVSVFAGAQMLGEGAERAMLSSGRDDTVIILRKGSDAELSSGIGNDYKKLGDLPQVAQVGGSKAIGEVVIVITAELADGSGGLSNVLVRGMPSDGIAFRPEVKIVSGRAPKPGTNEVVVGKAISGRFKGVGPGQSFELRRGRPLQVVGELSAGGSSYESEVWGDLDVIRQSLGRESGVSSVRVRLTSASQFDAYRTAVGVMPDARGRRLNSWATFSGAARTDCEPGLFDCEESEGAGVVVTQPANSATRTRLGTMRLM